MSKNLNYLCDGAISMRFDDMSENSFLKELFDYQKGTEKAVTIYVDEQNVSYLTVGEIAIKYSQDGYGGINWIDIADDEKYGKLPTITGVVIDYDGKTYCEAKDK